MRPLIAISVSFLLVTGCSSSGSPANDNNALDNQATVIPVSGVEASELNSEQQSESSTDQSAPAQNNNQQMDTAANENPSADQPQTDTNQQSDQANNEQAVSADGANPTDQAGQADQSTNESVTSDINELPSDNADSVTLEDNFDLPADSGTTPAPQGISIAPYSETSAELNWIRPAWGDGIMTNEIWRDGVLIETINGGGNSYIDTSRVPTLTYTYHIVANSRNGRATTKFVESNGTVANPWGPVISTEALPVQLQTELDNTFKLVKANALQTVLAFGNRISSNTPEELGLVLVENTDTESLYTCPNGGTITLYTTDYNSGMEGEACVINSTTFTGGIYPSQNTMILRSNTTLLDSRDNSLITIGYSRLHLNEQSQQIESYEIHNLKVTGPTHNYSATRINTYTGRIVAYGIEGTLGELSRMRTSEFDNNDLIKPESATLALYSMNAGNETYGINSDNENPETFTLNVTVNGTLTSYDIAWSDTYNLALDSITDIDVGF